jgi:septum site-determining protein MinC
MAGSAGNPRARIFCGKNEAELISVYGYYCTADKLTHLRNRSAQCWLEDALDI